MITYPKDIDISEVGPRDGLQNERGRFSIAQRAELCRGLIGAGIRRMETGTFGPIENVKDPHLVNAAIGP